MRKNEKLRKHIQCVIDAFEDVNISYREKDIDKNRSAYSRFKDLLGVLQTCPQVLDSEGVKVVAEETWEGGFVTIELTIEGVRF